MSAASGSTYNGIGLGGLLTIIFVIAKLFGKISWSWWWVFAPLWISWGIVGAVLLCILFCFIISEIVK